MRPLLLLTSLVLLAGCSVGADPSAPVLDPVEDPIGVPMDDASSDSLFRELAATKTVVLCGTTSTPPGCFTPPKSDSVPVAADQIALVQLKVNAEPAATNQVYAGFTWPTSHTGSFTYATGSGYQYVPLYADAAGNATVTLHNSPAPAGPVHPQAARWEYSLTAVNREDAGDAPDDDIAATYGERTGGSLLPIGATFNRSFYKKDEVRRDYEDWYKLSLKAWTTYSIKLATSNGTFGTWRYDLRLVNAAGSVVASKLGHSGTGSVALLAVNATGAAANYYLQVFGTPVSRRGNSVYYGKYSVSPVELPSVTTVGPRNAVAGVATEFTATATQNPTSYTWFWDGGNCSAGCTTARPTFTFPTAGTYDCTVKASNANGTGSLKPFQVQVTAPVCPTLPTHIVASGPSIRATNVLFVGDRPVIVFCDGSESRLKVIRATVNSPTQPADWDIPYTWRDSSAGSGETCHASVLSNGAVGIVYWANYGTGQTVRYLVSTNSSLDSWSGTLIDTYNGYHLFTVDNGGVPAVAYLKDNQLKVAVANSVTPSAWSIEPVGGTTTNGAPSLAHFQGKLVASFHNYDPPSTGELLQFGRRDSANNWNITDITSGFRVGFYSRLEVASGVLGCLNDRLICNNGICDFMDPEVKLTTVMPTGAGSWSTVVTDISARPKADYGMALAEVGGRFVAAYDLAGSLKDLRISRAKDTFPDFGSDWDYRTFDWPGDVGAGADIDGYPDGRIHLTAVDYTDGTQELLYARTPTNCW